MGTGSGFVIATPPSSISQVVTNYHVIRAGTVINVEFHDGKNAQGFEVLGEDPSLDLAILRVESKWGERLPQPMFDMQNTDEPPIGTRLYAIGSPMGMKNTLSDGLLSGYRSRDSQVTWVQITNPISPGSSGGPVFTDTGALVGITTASLPDAQNLNFAISAKRIQEFLARKKSPRPLWKGSCIECEERTFLLKFYKDVFERFRKKDSDPALRAPSDWTEINLWAGGLVISPHEQRFLDFCKTEAHAGNQSALILMGCFTLASSGLTNPEWTLRSNEAATLLKQALPLAGDDKFFVLLGIGKAQISIFGALETAGTLQEGARERFLDDALRAFEAARDLKPTFAPTLFELVETLTLRGKLSEALQVSAQLAPLVPNSPKAHALRGEILRLLGSKLAAIDEIRVACDLNPYDEFAFMQLGELYAETGQHEKSDRGLSLGPRRRLAPCCDLFPHSHGFTEARRGGGRIQSGSLPRHLCMAVALLNRASFGRLEALR